jgi:hypothetical protein
MEDSGLEDMMDENGEINAEAAASIADVAAPPDEAIDVTSPKTTALLSGEIRTLDGEVAGDEFAADAINYQVLLGKIDALLEKLKLDA